MKSDEQKIKLTSFSHSAGCGCKLSPSQLREVLKDARQEKQFKNLLIGNATNDDAAVYDLGDDRALISTVDFFMPIVDDAFDFGRIAAVNAINDVYAMGGRPIFALALLGWPMSKLSTELAAKVMEGAKSVCDERGIALAGGHSIDNLEPLFGLAVNGIIDIVKLKRNDKAQKGDLLYLTKGLGTGILSTALKRSVANEDQEKLLIDTLLETNEVGGELAHLESVHAMTDVTGFGLLGHLIEMCKGSGLKASVNFKDLPLLNEDLLKPLLDSFVIPDNTFRNFNSYSNEVNKLEALQLQVLCDPQTSGGLLIAVDPLKSGEVEAILKSKGEAFCIGSLSEEGEKLVNVH